MEDSKNYGHQHPLVLLNEDRLITNQSGVVAMCSRCGEKVSAPCFGCAEDCPFYLHKVCADAPYELNHPFHPFHHNDPLVLMENSPYPSGKVICDFCDEKCEKFFYHWSCGLDFHIKCALFTFDIAENHLRELEHVALQPPVIPTKKDDEQLEDVKKCVVCWEPLANYTHFSADCGFNLHKKCVELPLQKKHTWHRKHPLLLQFNIDQLACKICQETCPRKLAYGCSSCEFVVHIECLSPDLVIKDERHEHPFSLFRRRAPFICDACGTEGTYSAYICCECDIIVHKKCTSLPSIIKSKWHDHAVFHNYFLPDDFGSSDCIICHDAVSPEHGSYCCSICNITFHVRCVMKEASSYFIISREDADEISDESSITCVLERNDAGEATEIQHFKHIHNLLLSSFVGGYENSCDGCMLPISDPFYCCSQCQFFLHKTCAELPKKKHVWHHKCRQHLILISDKCFLCEQCGQVSNAFAYECDGCKGKTCLRCVIALTPSARTCPHHEHPLLYYQDYEARCNACGIPTFFGAILCKDCNFVLHHDCFSLPITVRHKCDKDLLKLTIHDDNSYSESHYCDICEQDREPNRSFYRCEICDTCAHVNCVLDRYPFIKLGSIYEESDHSHPLTFVKKSYYYPDCDNCHRPCEDLALECTKSGCNYIVHWDCVAPHYLRRFWFFV